MEAFLTDEQRELMKVATENAESHPPSQKPHSSLLAKPSAAGKASGGSIAVKHRRSHAGKPVRSKKDGCGGKGSWGKLIDIDSDYQIDPNDPNYDSGEEPFELVGATVSDPLDDYKKAVASIIEEYFSTGDVDVAASDLIELGSSEYHPYFIKRLVSVAMDRHDKEKEMASVLLSALYADVINPNQIRDGFVLLLESADDFVVDIPDAVDVLALFLARAVVDDILPPAFLPRATKALPVSSKGYQVVQTAEKSYLSAAHHAELVERRWGGTTRTSVEEVKKKIDDILNEYVETGETYEACRCIRELGVSFFHHEVVKRALITGMESSAAEPLVLKFLKEAASENLINSSQMVKGFSRLMESLDDLALDIPSAKTKFDLIVPKAISSGWLDASFSYPSGEGGRQQIEDEKLKRFKEEIVTIIHEYFNSDDIPELIRSLEDLGAPEYNPIFLKKLITLALDRKNREKEMASVLLSSLHIEMFTTEDVADGFVMLLESAEDTALDILDASNELALFLARAVIDDVLAPFNLEEISNKLRPNSSGTETVKMARSLIFARHAGERLLRCWGGGSGWAVEDAKDKIVNLLEEYESSGLVSEACKCIHELNMPFFNHEVVKKALVMAMEKKNDKKMLDLLQESFGEGLITTNQMTKGFTRVKDALEDLALDIPNAKEKFSDYVEHAKKKGWVSSAFVASLTEYAN
uniref:Programmed cell death protein 4 n=1 Tax=Noccaea caerulescens TaxID=107243 RepID=A0A1J3HF14_NOCCA